MQKWEYCHVTRYINKKNKWVLGYKGKEYKTDQLHDIMDELGEEGWELVATMPVTSTNVQGWAYTAERVLYFKRPKP